jgi:hypothetical protein
MEHEGPVLESLTRRLSETPEDFLAEPLIGSSGRIHVAAVVGDLLRRFGATPELNQLEPFTGVDERRDRNRLGITLVLCWLLSDEWFLKAKLSAGNLLHLLEAEAEELAGQVSTRKFIADPDRREELARVTLARLGFRPAGETIAQAQDRLSTISSSERARVMKAARVAEERARQIREAIARKAAEESADKWTRE